VKRELFEGMEPLQDPVSFDSIQNPPAASPQDELAAKKRLFKATIALHKWGDTLAEEHHQLLIALVSGVALPEAAKSQGKSEKTVRRWLSEWCLALGEITQPTLLAVYALFFSKRFQGAANCPLVLSAILQPLAPVASTQSLSPSRNHKTPNETVPPEPVVSDIRKLGSTESLHLAPLRSDRALRAPFNSRHLLNPVLWHDIMSHRDDLRASLDLLRPRLAEYIPIARAMRLLDTYSDVAEEPALPTARLSRLIATTSALYLPISLSMRFLGAPLSPEMTQAEADYEEDFGASQRARWAQERDRKLAFERTYDESMDISLWSMYSYDLRHMNRPVIAAQAKLPSHAYGPLIGFMASVCSDPNRMKSSNRLDDWDREASRIVRARSELLNDSGIDIREICQLFNLPAVLGAEQEKGSTG